MVGLVTASVAEPLLRDRDPTWPSSHPQFRSAGISAPDLERQILADADARRSGGTWQLHVESPVEIAGRDVTYDAGEWRWSSGDDPVDANVVASGGFVRATFVAERTPVGPSVGQRSIDFWRFADAALGTGIGPLVAAVEIGGSMSTSSR